jgi:hypothetical protein
MITFPSFLRKLSCIFALVLLSLVCGATVLHAQVSGSVGVSGAPSGAVVTFTHGYLIKTQCGVSDGGSKLYVTVVHFSNINYIVGSTTYPFSDGATSSTFNGQCGDGYSDEIPAVLPLPSTYDPGYTCTVTFTPRGVSGTAALSCVQQSVQGYINPKYKIVGIAYTVPGTSSYVQYTDTTMLGTSTSTSGAYSYNVTTSESICSAVGTGICGKGDGAAMTETYTNAFTQEADTSSSFAINQTTSFVDKLSPLTGPNLAHGNDIIYVWVNPNVWYTVTTPGAPLMWNGFTYDLNDDSNNMEVIPLRLSQLLNPSTIDSYTQGRLQRAWALTNTDGSSPAITNQDLLIIAAQDPFSDPNYTVTIGPDYQTTTDNRFTQTTNQELWYLPGQTNTYNWSYTGTTTAGQGAKTTYSDAFAVEEKFNASFFYTSVSYDLKQSLTFTWVDQWNKTTTNMTGEAASVQIVGPTTPYSGPDEFNVYVDNIYGTFMVFPVPSR